MRWLLYGLLGLGGYYVFTKVTAGKKVNVLFKKFGLSKPVGLSLPSIIAVFSLQNPTSTQFTVNSLVGDIFLNGQSFANVSDFSKVVLKPNSEVDLSVKISAGIVNSVSVIRKLIQKKQKVTATFKGHVNAEGFAIPINETIGV